ncbi:toxin [Actinocatenispora thailandica]|uniref:Toxin n=1 Tax=Actinocatenispora thailandica TaxID=227318 RepID=A0A7R7DJK4_9ACTN|nr:DUF397 domain-containing protein [Actinocatenispora thailandica]BCJ32773.1 toxin [Actinocatenispora thailandica]
MLVPDLTSTSWRKSSRSSGGADNCVEVAAGTTWRKSSRSTGANACVEVADGAGWAAVRDSKDPAGPVLVVSPAAFGAFVRDVTAGGRR